MRRRHEGQRLRRGDDRTGRDHFAKEVEGSAFTGLRFYLALPVTVGGCQIVGPFIHRPGDDDSAAVTFWGKHDLRKMLRKALVLLDNHYGGAGVCIEASAPVPMLLHCPLCGARHVDEGEFATKPHHTHACQDCGHAWRPALVDTLGVRFLPGFKDEKPA